jgi:Glycosyltransferase family 87
MTMTGVSGSTSVESCSLTWLLLSILCAAGMWTYTERVLIPYQISDAAAHNRPRGNLSDLYPRWLGARELLLHGRDPYGVEVSREIQAGYYGRPLDPSRRNDPRDEQRFAYPLYVIFLLAPTIGLPFHLVQNGFFWTMFALTAASTLLWIRVLRWAVSWWFQASLLLLTLGSLPVMQGLKLQQMSLLVAGLLAIAVSLLMADHSVAAGVLLAAASIKPQLVLLLLLWLALWTVADWRHRYPLAASYLLTMGVLITASEWYLPHWIPRFWNAILEYRRYTATASPTVVLVGHFWGSMFDLLAVLVFMVACWRERRLAANSSAFAFMVAFALVITVDVAPSFGPYNQVFLLPGILLLVKERRAIRRRSAADRLLSALAAILLFWPWFASTSLAALSFILPQPAVGRAWAVPFWSVLFLPAAVTALMLISGYHSFFTAPPRPRTS